MIDEAMINYVSALARLQLKKEEKKQIQKDLNNILLYVDRLQEVETQKGIAPSYDFEAVNVLRKDEVIPSLPAQEVLANSVERTEQYFQVPHTLEEQQT